VRSSEEPPGIAFELTEFVAPGGGIEGQGKGAITVSVDPGELPAASGEEVGLRVLVPGNGLQDAEASLK
jgi:hypothetical protein